MGDAILLDVALCFLFLTSSLIFYQFFFFSRMRTTKWHANPFSVEEAKHLRVTYKNKLKSTKTVRWLVPIEFCFLKLTSALAARRLRKKYGGFAPFWRNQIKANGAMARNFLRFIVLTVISTLARLCCAHPPSKFKMGPKMTSFPTKAQPRIYLRHKQSLTIALH